MHFREKSAYFTSRLSPARTIVDEEKSQTYEILASWHVRSIALMSSSIFEYIAHVERSSFTDTTRYLSSPRMSWEMRHPDDENISAKHWVRCWKKGDIWKTQNFLIFVSSQFRKHLMLKMPQKSVLRHQVCRRLPKIVSSEPVRSTWQHPLVSVASPKTCFKYPSYAHNHS